MIELSACTGSSTGSAHSAFSSWKPTPGQALRSVARISCESAAASPALATPDSPTTRLCAGARMLPAPSGITAAEKAQSMAASPVVSRTVTATQASSNHEDLARRRRKETPRPRTDRP